MFYRSQMETDLFFFNVVKSDFKLDVKNQL